MRREHLTREEVESVMKERSWIAQGGNRYRVYGNVRGRTVRIVFAQEDDNDIVIITVFYDD